MSTQVLIQNEFATVAFHPEKGIIHHTFHKPISGEPFRQVLNTGIEELRKHSASKWLSDDRLNMALPEEDTEWSKTDWFPRALAAGWKHWALVVPPDIMARMNLAEFVDMYHEQGLNIRVFTDPDRAVDWLESIED